MPNWCVGTLKIRGDKENVRKFLLESITVPGSVFGNTPELEVEEDDNYLRMKSKWGLYVKGSHRQFIQGEIEWYAYDGVNTLCIDCYEGAWGIDTETLVRLSKEYQIDIKIYAFERGMKFNLDFEVHKGELIKDLEVTFDDYEWDCPCPTMGG